MDPRPLSAVRADAPIVALSTNGLARLLAALLVAALTALMAAATAEAAGPSFLQRINSERTTAGLPALTQMTDLDGVAQAWSDELGRSSVLRHNPNLSQQVGNWWAIAENVGYAGSEAAVHSALMASPGHRANILGNYSQVGIGVTYAGGRVWVTQVFRRPQRAVQVMPEGDARAYVRKIYVDLLGRQPDAAGQAGWAAQLQTGTSPSAVTDAITSGNEFRARLVAGGYDSLLGRSPEQSGMNGWLAFLAAGGTLQQLDANIVASPEFFRRSGGTNESWVRQNYATVLGRPASAAEVRYWVGQLDAGRSRSDVAVGFLLSTEDLSAVVDGYYRTLLGRPSDAAGRAHWVGAIQGGARSEQIVASIVASPEYYARR